MKTFALVVAGVVSFTFSLSIYAQNSLSNPWGKPVQKVEKPKKPRKPQPSRSAARENQQTLPVLTSPEEDETRLTKNWGGSRKSLSNLGIDIGAIYKIDFMYNYKGGLEKKLGQAGNFDLRLSLDFEKMSHIKGLTAFVYGIYNHGNRPSVFHGDAQWASNIEVPVPGFRVFEAWAQQLFYDDRLSLLVGIHDLNAEFYVTDSSLVLLHSAFGIGNEFAQTGLNGPSIFPYSAVSARLRAEPSKQFYIQTAVFNAQAGDRSNLRATFRPRLTVSDGALVVTEAAYLRGKEDTSQRSGKYGFGFWTYTTPFDHQYKSVTDSLGNSVPEKGISNGFYILADQNLSEQLSVFYRFGMASSVVNRFGSGMQGGLQWIGLIPGRHKDRLALGFARSTNGDEYKLAQAEAGTPVSAESETAYELTYRVEVSPGIAIQPDFQWIQNPNTNQNTPDAYVLGARLEVNL